LQTEIYKNFRAELNILSVNVVNKGMEPKRLPPETLLHISARNCW
jgi:hypothetical protein